MPVVISEFMNCKSLGVAGESVALLFVRALGWIPTLYNYRESSFELDLVAVSHDFTCAIEVKTRVIAGLNDICAESLFSHQQTRRYLYGLAKLKLSEQFNCCVVGLAILVCWSTEEIILNQFNLA